MKDFWVLVGYYSARVVDLAILLIGILVFMLLARHAELYPFY